MKLESIDKNTYRQRLNRIIIGFIVTLTILSVAYGAALITIFTEILSQPEMNEGMTNATSNFKYNLAGVILALLSCAALLNFLKTTTFFKEIYYVWQLKQIHNLIYRKLKKIKAAAFDKNDEKAMVILYFYYTSLLQVYVLDDNTLTLSSVKLEQQKLNELLLEKDKSINVAEFDKQLIAMF